MSSGALCICTHRCDGHYFTGGRLIHSKRTGPCKDKDCDCTGFRAAHDTKPTR